MKTVNSVDDLVQAGYKNICLVDAQDYEVLKYRKQYPSLNIWATKAADITDDTIYHNEGCGTVTVLPPKIHLYPELVNQDTVYVCMELVGGLGG